VATVDQTSVDVPLSLFSSLNTELSPPDLPEGISPDNGDVIYLPGSVSTRPGTSRVFLADLRANSRISYEKTYVQPSGVPQNLYLTSDGGLYLEDVTVTPGVATLLYQSTATMASSVTAFGREYIALSDGKHGADIPLQWDGKQLYRVTQDGPGAPPTVNSIALPPSTLALSPSATAGIVNAFSGAPIVVGGVTYYTELTITLVAPFPPAFLYPGALISVAGNSIAAYTISGALDYVSSDGLVIQIHLGLGLTTTGIGLGGVASGPIATLSRNGNTVSATTSTPHSLKVGYQVQVQGVSATVVGGTIATIELVNADNPGVATVTTTAEHGLLPGNIINIDGVNTTAVGGGISNIELSGDVVKVTTASAHGLQIGSVVNVAPVTNSKLTGQWTVTTVPTPSQFTYAFIDTDIASGADTGTVEYVWPLANVNQELNYFTVLTAPTSTSFTIGLSYTDGTWTGGTASFAWDGIFYVTSVSSDTSFQYRQYGPPAITNSAGTVTPYGQATPGIHQVQQCFLLQSGAITEPSPPGTFVANGGQYLSVTDLAIGSANVAGRILLFTGAGGAYFFYISQPAQVNGLIVSTATQINDNTTTSVLLDFADATLYKATACSVPGNTLAEQVVLGPCAGFFTYASRLQAWGEYNKVQNFLNMGFEGGYKPVAPTLPLGWTPGASSSGGSLVATTIPGFAYQVTAGGAGNFGELYQSAYQDAYGDPILLANTQYSARFKTTGASGSGLIHFSISSASTGFSSTGTITIGGPLGDWDTVVLTNPTPASIPADMIIDFYVTSDPSGVVTQIDEIELIYTDQPYLDHQELMSYAENPEGFDGLTGIIGPEDDLTPIMNHGVLRNNLYFVTGNAVHETVDNGSTEPSGWNVEQVDDECGAWSIASVARNPQGIGSAGKGFMAWSGPDGAHVFTGRNPEKCSQEIQSLWDGMDTSKPELAWAKNDQVNKRIYFGIPTAVINPNPPPFFNTVMQVLVLDYRNLATDQIGSLPPIRISFTGKMIASDLTRKWTKWTINAYCGEIMYRSASDREMTFGGATFAGNSQAWTLTTGKYSDDDTQTGIIPAYYTTYFFVGHEAEQALQLGSHRKQYDYLTAYCPGVGTLAVTPLLCSLANTQSPTPNIAMTSSPDFDLEIGINVLTARCAFRFAATPFTGQTDSYFSLQKMVVNMKKAPWQWVRGTNSGGS